MYENHSPSQENVVNNFIFFYFILPTYLPTTVKYSLVWYYAHFARSARYYSLTQEFPLTWFPWYAKEIEREINIITMIMMIMIMIMIITCPNRHFSGWRDRKKNDESSRVASHSFLFPCWEVEQGLKQDMDGQGEGGYRR